MHAEPGDEVVELRHPPREDGRIVLPCESERRCSRRRFGQGELLPVGRPRRVSAVDLDEADHLLAEVDRRGVHAPRAALLPAHQVRSRRLDRGEVADEHRVAGGERVGGRAEVGDGVGEAAERRRFAGRGCGHRLECPGVAVVAKDVAGDGAQLVPQPAGEREQQVLRPRRGLRLVGDDAVGQGAARLLMPARRLLVARAAWPPAEP